MDKEIIDFVNEHFPDETFLFKDNGAYLETLIQQKQKEIRTCAAEMDSVAGSQILATMQTNSVELTALATTLAEADKELTEIQRMVQESLATLSPVINSVRPVHAAKKNIERNLQVLKAVSLFENSLQVLKGFQSYREVQSLFEQTIKVEKLLASFGSLPYPRQLCNQFLSVKKEVIAHIEKDVRFFVKEHRSLAEDPNFFHLKQNIFSACSIYGITADKNKTRKLLRRFYADTLEGFFLDESSDFLDRLVVFIKTRVFSLAKTWKDVVPTEWNLSACFVEDLLTRVSAEQLPQQLSVLDKKFFSFLEKVLTVENELDKRFKPKGVFLFAPKFVGLLSSVLLQSEDSFRVKEFTDGTNHILVQDEKKFSTDEEGKFVDAEQFLGKLARVRKRDKQLRLDEQETAGLCAELLRFYAMSKLDLRQEEDSRVPPFFCEEDLPAPKPVFCLRNVRRLPANEQLSLFVAVYKTVVFFRQHADALPVSLDTFLENLEESAFVFVVELLNKEISIAIGKGLQTKKLLVSVQDRLQLLLPAVEFLSAVVRPSLIKEVFEKTCESLENLATAKEVKTATEIFLLDIHSLKSLFLKLFGDASYQVFVEEKLNRVSNVVKICKCNKELFVQVYKEVFGNDQVLFENLVETNFDNEVQEVLKEEFVALKENELEKRLKIDLHLLE